jgi:cytochrome P450
MVLTEGGEWRGQRDAFNPGFASTFLRDAQPQFVACTRDLIARLEAAADAGAAAGGKQGGEGVVLMHHLTVLLVGWVLVGVCRGVMFVWLVGGGVATATYRRSTNAEPTLNRRSTDSTLPPNPSPKDP